MVASVYISTFISSPAQPNLDNESKMNTEGSRITAGNLDKHYVKPLC